MDLSREQIIFIVLCVGFSQALFGGIMLLLKKKARLPDKILSIWLLSFALQLGVSIANHRFILTAFPVTPFIYAPLLYIYIHTLISEKPMLKKWYYLTLFPAVGFIIPAVLFRNSSVWIYENFLTGDKYIALRMIYVVTILLSFIGYPLGTFIEIHKHRQKMKNIFSYTSKRIDLSWALFVSISFFVFYFGIFVLGLIRVLIRQFPFDPELPGYAVLIFYSFVFSIFGYQQERIYPAENGRFPAYSRSGLTRDKAEKLMSDIHW